MDYLDLKQQSRHRILLLTGYVLIAVAIVIASLVLLYQAYGFGLGKNGTVIQNGLTFFSSHPSPADIFIDGKRKAATNTRLALPAGIYNVKLTRDGYNDWQRMIDLKGGSVHHFDYPFLFPKTLTTNKIQTYNAPPSLSSQSPDHKWLLIGRPGALAEFDIYDLKNPNKGAEALSLPANLLSKAATAESWQKAEWADNNRHVLLEHVFDGKTEYILFDRENPGQSQNINTTLSVNPTQLTLKDKKSDQYYLYDGSTADLQTASLNSPTPITVLKRVLAYHTYGKDTILFATDIGAPTGKVLIKLAAGNTTSIIRNFPSGGNYLLDLTKYSGNMYVVASASNGTKTYIYKDPAGQLAKDPKHMAVPVQVLHVEQPSYLSFSASAQFIVTENGTRFGVYDIENEVGYNYSTPNPIDAPQAHASWMDGDRLLYSSGGKLAVFDYDATNNRSLTDASSLYLPAFSPDYKYVYSLIPNGATGQYILSQTPLLTPKDL